MINQRNLCVVVLTHIFTYFRIFLKVSRLQKEIIDIVLDELTSTISDEEHDVPRLRLLLSQLRYLPHIKDPQSLTTKLLDILDIASFPSQLEILDSIPEILPDSEYSETASELIQMLDKSDDLASAIIDCLNALNLDADTRARIQDHILAKMLTGTSTKTFPVFLDFLMSDCTSRTLPGTLMKIRSSLNAIMGNDNPDKDKESSKVVIFTRLQKSAVTKVVSEGWLSLISNIKVHTDHKPIDLIILFMLHSNTKLKKRTIETTFRKRVKEGLFKCGLLEQGFDKYFPQQLLRDYFNSVVEIGSGLLRTSDDPVVTDFASTLFKLLFTHDYTIPTFRQEILENMVVLVGSSDQKNLTAILNILVELLDDVAKSPNHAIILMRLLEKIDTCESNDVRLVYEILCRLTCYDESLLGLKEEIHMVIRKHLSSSKRSLKLRGIIAGVVMAKHVAATMDDQSDLSLSEETILSVNQLKGSAKEAAAILELTNTSACTCPELLGLYYDELGSMLVKSDKVDKNFVTWLYDLVTNEFQHMYVAESVCDAINDLEFSKQFDINSEDEVDSLFAVNIAELTLKPEKNSILVLAPHFRLLRMLHFRHHNGDLSSIDALLGCGVILPKFEQRDSVGIEQLKQMADCVFHCINWFRETISGFVVQKEPKLRSKVIRRVDDLHELENLLLECLENVPSHKLPQSYFGSQSTNRSGSPIKEATKVGKAPRKKLKTREFVEDTSVAPCSSNPPPKTKLERKFTFREIDTDLVKLLKYPLTCAEMSSTVSITLNLNQFNFILTDYVAKLTKLTKKRDLGLSHLNIVAPSDLISDCHKVLLNVNQHFEVIIKKMDEIEQCDDNETTQLKLGFGLVLECLSVIFSWSGFQHSKRLDTLREILKSFRSDITSTPLNSVNLLTAELVNRLSDYTKYCSSLKQAVDLIATTEALFTLSPNPSTRSKIAKTAGTLLKQKWQTQSSTNVDVLIKSYLSSATIKTICGMVGTLQDEAPTLTTKSDSLDMLQTVTKSHFYIFYRNLWTSLHERVKTEVQSLTNSQHLTLWRTTALTMQGLMTVVKAQESKANLVCFLKKSVAILKIFLSHGIPILEIELKSEPDRVVEIFKTIQSNTRFLHHLCCYSKLMKDASLMTYVPQFRLTLETLVFRVKAALVANGCSAAFWMGNLRNRDLQGEDILSQSTEASREENEDEDEEMPSDDDLDDGGDQSGSEGSEVFG